MNLQPIGRILLRLRKICLHEMGDVARRRHGNQICAAERDQNQGGCRYQHGLPRAVRSGENGIREKRAVRRNHKREAVNPRDGRDLQQREAADGGIAGEIPGEADDGEMRAREFEGDPEKRGEHAGKRITFSRCERDANRKHRADDSARDADEAHDSSRGPRVHIAVLLHHDGDPGQADGIEDHAVKKPVEKRFGRTRARRRPGRACPRQSRRATTGCNWEMTARERRHSPRRGALAYASGKSFSA